MIIDSKFGMKNYSTIAIIRGLKVPSGENKTKNDTK
jgi:hypothetical protein